jgi:predicted metal-binding membrane protein
MIGMILVFIITFLLVFGGISLFRSMSGKEKWQFTKIFAYGIIVAWITVAILAGIVFLF